MKTASDKNVTDEVHSRASAVALGSGLCIWRVRYDCRFESSSGMQRYHIDHKDCTGLVATEGEYLGAVRAAICDHIGPQSRLMALHEAHYLGCTLNDPNNEDDRRRSP